MDLVDEGYLSLKKEGRRNVYTVNPHVALRHPLEQDYEVGDVLASIGASPQSVTLSSSRSKK